MQNQLVLSYPIRIAIELTYKCNNFCPACSNNCNNFKTPKITSSTQWAKWFSQFVNKSTLIRLTGGEPTLHPEFLEILNILKSYSIWINILTNARWEKSDKILQSFSKIPKLNLTISLHGNDEEMHNFFVHTPNAFSESVENIKKATNKGIKVDISTVLTQKNYNKTKDIINFIKKLGVNSITFNRYLGKPLPTIEASNEQLLKAIKDIKQSINNKHNSMKIMFTNIPQCFIKNPYEGCQAGTSYVAIDPLGNIKPCTLSPTIIGSLQNDSFYNLWHSDKMNKWRNKIDSKCINCAAYSFCHGGCRALSELRHQKCDPLITKSYKKFTPKLLNNSIPIQIRPKPNFTTRKESFGIAILGNGFMIPVKDNAKLLLQSINGKNTFKELINLFGEESKSLLGILWNTGLLKE